MQNHSKATDNGKSRDQCDRKKSVKGKLRPCTWIEVCQGPDCTGLGAGAAILEIEELVGEYHFSCQVQQEHSNDESKPLISVVEGGCRDLCSSGPNVHIRIRNPDTSTRKRRATVTAESFSVVTDPSKCNDVVEAAVRYVPALFQATNALPIPTSNLSIVQAMMARRAERTRWEVLRDVSRTLSKCRREMATKFSTRDEKCDGRQLQHLKEITRTRIRDSLAFATMSLFDPDREERRKERILQIALKALDNIFRRTEYYEDSDESSTSSDSCNSKIE